MVWHEIKTAGAIPWATKRQYRYGIYGNRYSGCITLWILLPSITFNGYVLIYLCISYIHSYGFHHEWHSYGMIPTLED